MYSVVPELHILSEALKFQFTARQPVPIKTYIPIYFASLCRTVNGKVKKNLCMALLKQITNIVKLEHKRAEIWPDI